MKRPKGIEPERWQRCGPMLARRSRDVHELLFEVATGVDEPLRQLAAYLHDPRTNHPPKPSAIAYRMPRKL